MKKILCSLVAVLCLYSIIQLGKAFSSDIPNFDEENKVVSEETNDKESETISDLEEDKASSEKGDAGSKEEKQEENNNQSNSKEPEIINNTDDNSKNEKIIKEEPQTPTEQPKVPDNVPPVKKETPKEIPVVEQPKTAWEELGISEEEYYRSPVWKWQEVMFGIYLSGDNYCSNAAECREKCVAYGDSYISEHTGTYRCTTVNSYSGDYLGEDFDYKLLQP